MRNDGASIIDEYLVKIAEMVVVNNFDKFNVIDDLIHHINNAKQKYHEEFLAFKEKKALEQYWKKRQEE